MNFRQKTIIALIMTAAALAQAEKDFDLVAGDYKITINADAAYSIRKIYYAGNALGEDRGFYGSIFAAQPNKFTGAGHKEGGEEKVESVAVTIDGVKTDIDGGGVCKGNRVELRKVSMLNHLRMDKTITLTPDRIVIRLQLEAMEKQDVYSFYPFQFCWRNTMTDWLAQLPDGKEMRGSFADNTVWQLNKAIRWAAIYDAVAGKGFLMYYDEVLPVWGRGNTFWNQDRYKKYYLMLKLPKLLAKGFKSPDYVINLKGFAAPAATWQPQVRRLAETMNINKQQESK